MSDTCADKTSWEALREINMEGERERRNREKESENSVSVQVLMIAREVTSHLKSRQYTQAGNLLKLLLGNE